MRVISAQTNHREEQEIVLVNILAQILTVQLSSLQYVLAQGSPIFHSSCQGERGIALELQKGKRDLI